MTAHPITARPLTTRLGDRARTRKENTMIGARAVMRSLAGAGVAVCFVNPGTSEMHLVHELDATPQLRGVLALCEGVATGAADGYARIAGHPAAVLLHLGPGLAGGLANLHNARRAQTPVVVLVGEHATAHQCHDTPLQSDIAALAGTVSGWSRTCSGSRDVGADADDAVAASLEGQVATLVLPADVSWDEGAQVAAPRARARTGPVDPDPVDPNPVDLDLVDLDLVDRVASVLDSRTLLLLGAGGTREPAVRAASRISAATGVRLLAERFPPRQERGAGVPRLDRLAYLPGAAARQLEGLERIVLVGARAPVSFFAYPGVRSELAPPDTDIITLAAPDDDHAAIAAALDALAERVAPDTDPVLAGLAPPPTPTGTLTVTSLGAAVGATLPHGAIVVDEGQSSSLGQPRATAHAARHDWLTQTGGSLGYGLPAALGAAIAAPNRPVLCLQADGAALYTPQTLWSMARENVDVTVLLIHNDAYAILRRELQDVAGGEPSPTAQRLLDLTGPAIDHAGIARGLGVPATRVNTADELVDALRRAYTEPGPHLIEAMVPPLF